MWQPQMIIGNAIKSYFKEPQRTKIKLRNLFLKFIGNKK